MTRVQPIATCEAPATGHGVQVVVFTCASGDYSAYGTSGLRLSALATK